MQTANICLLRSGGSPTLTHLQEMSDETEKSGGSSLGSEVNDTTESAKERLQMRRILVEQQQQLLSQYNRGMRNNGDNGKQNPIF